MNIYGEYFYGNRISDYGLQNGYVDYGTLAKAFDTVLNNDIKEKTKKSGLGYWEMVSGQADNSDEIERLNEEITETEQNIDECARHACECFDSGDSEGGNKWKDRADGYRSALRDKEDALEELEREETEVPEVFQWYIVSDQGAEILQEINEIVYYNQEIDVYLWGVTHYGTMWSHVLTNIPCNTGKV